MKAAESANWWRNSGIPGLAWHWHLFEITLGTGVMENKSEKMSQNSQRSFWEQSKQERPKGP